MPDELKVGDVVLVECHCHSCSVFGPPDPGPNNGPFIITRINKDGIYAKAPFESSSFRHWNKDMVTFRVVGRADEPAA